MVSQERRWAKCMVGVQTANIAAEFTKDIPGVTEENAERIHTLFNARRTYFHTNVFTAAMFLDSEFITDKHKKRKRSFARYLNL